MQSLSLTTYNAATSHSRHLISRGALAVLFGLVLLVWPVSTIAVVVTAYGVFALADGSVALFAAKAVPGERSLLIVQGVATIASGLIAVVWPGVTVVALLFVIGAWAVLKGVTEIALAFRHPEFVANRTRLGLAGALSVLFGLVMFARPVSGVHAMVILVAALAISTGVVVISAGVNLDRAERGLRDIVRESELPSPSH